MSTIDVERIEAKEVAVAAGTAEASASTTAFAFAPGLLVGLEVTVPSGHAGLTGLALLQAGEQLIPRTRGDWLVADNAELRYALAYVAESRLWTARAFNTDVYPHTFYLRFLFDELVREERGEPTPLVPLTF